jgi:hypothetical protein
LVVVFASPLAGEGVSQTEGKHGEGSLFLKCRCRFPFCRVVAVSLRGALCRPVAIQELNMPLSLPYIKEGHDKNKSGKQKFKYPVGTHPTAPFQPKGKLQHDNNKVENGFEGFCACAPLVASLRHNDRGKAAFLLCLPL